MISDHSISHSGVGTQSFHLIKGLIETGKYSFKQLGAAIKHANYDPITLFDGKLIIRPVDGFGNPELIRQILATEKIDAILLFTDPRFFMHIWENHDEIHNAEIPLTYWNLWDAPPVPAFQKWIYESCDLLNCISKLSYEMVSEMRADITHYVPHFLPEELFFPLPKEKKIEYKKQLIGKERKDSFVGLWVNRNAKRKRSNDILWAWKLFLDKLEAKHGHRNAVLCAKTDPIDSEGVDMYATSQHFGIVDNIFFCKEFLQFEQMNVLHNIADFYVNISYAEGWGIGSHESLQCGVPAIVAKTGGETDKIVNPETKEEHGIALDIDFETMVGSPQIPFIKEQYCSVENVANAMLKMYEFGPEKRQELGQLGREYVLKNFNAKDIINKWDETLEYTIKTWRERRKSWNIQII